MSARRHLPLLLATAAVVLATSGCGSSGTKTVSVSSALPSEGATQRTSTTGTTKSSPTTTTPPGTTTSTNGTGGVETTRTSSAPAFTKESTGGGEGLGAAVALVKAHGYTAGETSTYRPEQTLRVLVGTRTGSSDGYGQQAFFFVDGHYLGTDTSEPSSSVKVVGQSDTEVTLAYPVYKAGDPLSKPSSEKTVRFQLNNGRLVPLEKIPPASQRTG